MLHASVIIVVAFAAASVRAACVDGDCNEANDGGYCWRGIACICNADWFYPSTGCATYCLASTTCSNNGVCDSDGTCDCYSGLEIDCSEALCVAEEDCSGHGTCSTYDDSCICGDGFNGTDCSSCAENYFADDCSVFCDPETTCTDEGGETCYIEGVGCLCGEACNSVVTHYADYGVPVVVVLIATVFVVGVCIAFIGAVVHAMDATDMEMDDILDLVGPNDDEWSGRVVGDSLVVSKCSR